MVSDPEKGPEAAVLMVGILGGELIICESHNICGEIWRGKLMRERIVLFFGSDCENEGFDFSRPKYRESQSVRSVRLQTRGSKFPRFSNTRQTKTRHTMKEAISKQNPNLLAPNPLSRPVAKVTVDQCLIYEP